MFTPAVHLHGLLQAYRRVASPARGSADPRGRSDLTR
jgi:hypothetical protein